MSIRVNCVLSGKGRDNFMTSIALSNIKNANSSLALKLSKSPVKKEIDLYHYYDIHKVKNPLYPAICSIYLSLEELEKELPRFKDELLKVKKIICLNKEQQDLLAKNGIINTVIIPLGVDKDIYNSKLQKKTSNKVVIGMFSEDGFMPYPKPYIDNLAKVLSPESFSFFIIGDELEEYAIMLSSYGFDLEYFHRMPQRLMPQVYDSISVLLLGFGSTRLFSIVEAVAMATPIVTFTNELVGDYLEYGVNAITLKRDAYKDIKLFQDLKDGMLDKMAEGALKKQKLVLSNEQVAKKICDLYISQEGISNAA